MKKKYYYATKFSSYTAKRENASSVSKQTNPVSRYALFFRDPKKLFSNPLIGLGMLFMKTAEFVAGGIGLVTVKMGTYGKK